MNTKYLIYYCKGIESVFDSQVLELIISLNEKKIFHKIYLFLGIRNNDEMKEYFKRNIPEEIEVNLFKAYSNYAIFNPFSRMQIKKSLKNTKEIAETAIFHIREELLAWHIAQILDKKYYSRILPDVRGASLEEIMENREITSVQKYFKLWNIKKALKYLNNYKRISAVSEALKKYLTEKHQIKSDKIMITPDLAGKYYYFDKINRNRVRQELNLTQQEILIVFSNGSTSQWQNWQNKDILLVLAEKGVKILNLSRYEVDHKNIINKYAKYCDMPSFLSAADIAIIWSDKRTVTEVRSPVKFSEYVCCGLPVIANDSVVMITEYLKKTRYGILLKSINELNIEILNKLKNIDREEISAYGHKWYGVESITDAYIKIYNSIS